MDTLPHVAILCFAATFLTLGRAIWLICRNGQDHYLLCKAIEQRELLIAAFYTTRLRMRHTRSKVLLGFSFGFWMLTVVSAGVYTHHTQGSRSAVVLVLGALSITLLLRALWGLVVRKEKVVIEGEQYDENDEQNDKD